MDTLRQAAQQALEALVWSNEYLETLSEKLFPKSKKPQPGSTTWHVHKAITALRTALAEQPAEQEPVAHLYRDHNGELRLNCIKPVPYFAFPVYTAPQPRREVELTDEEILKLAYPLRHEELTEREADTAVYFARALIEAYRAKQEKT